MKVKQHLIFYMILDLLMVNVALGIMISLSYSNFFWPEILWGVHLGASLIAVSIFYMHGMYHRLWQFAGIRDYLMLMQSVILYALILFFCSKVFWPVVFQPLQIAVLVCVFGFLTGSWRLSGRMNRELRPQKKEQKSKPALIVGAGGAGTLVCRTLMDNQSLLKPLGYVDDDSEKQGMRLMGLPIMGTRSDIPKLAEQLNIEEIIIAIPSASGSEIGEIVKMSRNTRARLKILPSVFQIIGGKIPEEQIREIQVEDLLNRQPVKLNLELVEAYIKGKVVLVTGAGGSVGAELCVQLAGFSPATLVILGRGENSIYEIEAQLLAKTQELDIQAEIADVRDPARITAVFKKYGPDVVFHAAAHKHVPLMEKSPAEAFKNNVLGTLNVARAALQSGVETFVLISTDKAVNPTSIMGATKQMAEGVVRNFSGSGKTRFAVVRFGNVLGSRGSVVPVFKRQIASGGPVTVTHPDMVRYFMTISEAAQLVIEAGALARGGEIFVLDMGEPVKIVDLALNMIKLSGYRPGKDIEVKFTGIRPGEKLYEELFGKEESLIETEHEKIYQAYAAVTENRMTNFLVGLNGTQLEDEISMEILAKFVRR